MLTVMPVGAEAAALAEALKRAVGESDGLIERLPIGICACDKQGRILRYNERAVWLWGYAPQIGDEIFRVESALNAVDGHGQPLTRETSPITRALTTGKPVTDSTIQLRRADGVIVSMLTNVEPLFDEKGAIIGAVKCFQDNTPQKETERRIRNGARAMRTLVDALPAAIYTTDAEGRITFFNKSAATLWGREPVLNEDMWCGSHRLLNMDGSALPREECPMAVTLKTQEPVRNREAIVERPDGTRVPVMPYPTPLFDAEGNLVAGINMLVDITERKKFDERQKVLIDELNHRVKNTLATVQAMAVQSFRRTEGEREDVDAFLARLLALSRTHDHLTREHWEAADLRAVVEDVLRPLSDRPSGGVSLDGVSMRISPRAALTLGLILNELATNAAKYGSLSSPEGKLRVAWRVRDDEFLLTWRESDGPPVGPVSRRGFGTRMIERGLQAELDGNAHLRFEPAGFECDLRIPLAGLF